MNCQDRDFVDFVDVSSPFNNLLEMYWVESWEQIVTRVSFLSSVHCKGSLRTQRHPWPEWDEQDWNRFKLSTATIALRTVRSWWTTASNLGSSLNFKFWDLTSSDQLQILKVCLNTALNTLNGD
jgi:hypothetical protein